MVVQRFIKKPVQIEALQFTGDAVEIFRWVESTIGKRAPIDNLGITIYPASGGLLIQTPEEQVEAFLGDWIIKERNNSFSVCRREEFESRYDPVMIDEPAV